MKWPYRLGKLGVVAVLLVGTPIQAQIVYVGLASTACSQVREPAVQVEYMVNVQQQKVMSVTRRLDGVTVRTDVEKACTVINPKNWQCEDSGAVEGVVWMKSSMLGYRHCFFEKKLFGGWRLKS
jgi:hypothetical protein